MTASLTDTAPDTAGWFTAAVAAELRAHMARQRISGREVARRLHVSAQWISLRTKGASPLSTDEIERICVVLGITPQQLLSGAFASANGSATGVATLPYRSATGHPRPALTLVRASGDGYCAVDAGNGSSTPAPGYTDGRPVRRSAKGVDNADAA